jgi:hypothetical protein
MNGLSPIKAHNTHNFEFRALCKDGAPPTSTQELSIVTQIRHPRH